MEADAPVVFVNGVFASLPDLCATHITDDAVRSARLILEEESQPRRDMRERGRPQRITASEETEVQPSLSTQRAFPVCSSRCVESMTELQQFWLVVTTVTSPTCVVPILLVAWRFGQDGNSARAALGSFTAPFFGSLFVLSFYSLDMDDSRVLPFVSSLVLGTDYIVPAFYSSPIISFYLLCLSLCL